MLSGLLRLSAWKQARSLISNRTASAGLCMRPAGVCLATGRDGQSSRKPDAEALDSAPLRAEPGDRRTTKPRCSAPNGLRRLEVDPDPADRVVGHGDDLELDPVVPERGARLGEPAEGVEDEP